MTMKKLADCLKAAKHIRRILKREDSEDVDTALEYLDVIKDNINVMLQGQKPVRHLLDEAQEAANRIEHLLADDEYIWKRFVIFEGYDRLDEIGAAIRAALKEAIEREEKT
ncbi:MAG: hypothetical protein LBR80_04680 [Deltaproteobacteria bacterium]|jgi:archaellum component FlaC|nr:hypothetical protein [Deltaproteobacteria bacterium]